MNSRSDWDGHVQFAVNHIGSRRSDLRPAQNTLKGKFGAYTTVDFQHWYEERISGHRNLRDQFV